MDILRKRTILKLAATFMVVAMMAGAFVGYAKAAVAATTAICDPGSVIIGTGTNCFLNMSVTPSASSDLAFTSIGAVITSTPHAGLNTFTFTADVTDVRTGAGTPKGWQLQAESSSGLDGISPSMVSIATPVCAPADTVVATGSNCPLPAITTTTPLSSSSPTSFANTTVLLDGSGTVHFTVNGTYTIPAGTSTATTFTGTITLSLLDTAA